MEQTYNCACCGEVNETVIDQVNGEKQEYVEDCRVCCRPNVITATWNPYTEQYDLSVYQEDVG